MGHRLDMGGAPDEQPAHTVTIKFTIRKTELVETAHSAVFKMERVGMITVLLYSTTTATSKCGEGILQVL